MKRLALLLAGIGVFIIGTVASAQVLPDPAPKNWIRMKDSSNVLGGGKDWLLKQSTKISMWTEPDPILGLDRIHIFAEDSDLPSHVTRLGYPDYHFYVSQKDGVTTGLIKPENDARFSIHAKARDCYGAKGSAVAIKELKLDGASVQRIRAQFLLQCTTISGPEKISGEFFYQAAGYDGGGDDETPDDGGDDGGDDDEEEPPPPPPATVHVSLPSDLGITPVHIANAASQTVAFSTAISETFNDNVHLAITSNAPETSDFVVGIDPAVIAAPGTGEGHITIQTGPMTRPGFYDVTVFAMSGDWVSNATFQVFIDCTPPSINAIHQPKPVVAQNGSSVALEVTADGTGPFLYQWYKGMPGMTNEPVLSANEPKLIFAARETSTYWVRVRNACGSFDSNAALVKTVGELTGPVKRRSRR